MAHGEFVVKLKEVEPLVLRKKRLLSTTERWFCDWCGDEHEGPRDAEGETLAWFPRLMHYTEAQKNGHATIEPICKPCAQEAYPEAFE